MTESWRDDPYSLLARLRQHDPVNETPVGIFRLTRYRDVVRMLKEVPSGVRLADGSIFGAIETADGGPNEFLLRADLALPVPSTVICEMMQVPLADRDRFTGGTAADTVEWGASLFRVLARLPVRVRA